MEEKSQKPISQKLQFIDSARFTTSSLSNPVDNHAKVIPKIKWKNLQNHIIQIKKKEI